MVYFRVMKKTPLDYAIFHAGGVSALGEYLGKSRQTIHAWKKKGRIPGDYALPVSKLTGIPVEVILGDRAASHAQSARSQDL